jgi:phage N-6-adenine-methyltransferase
MKTVHVSTDSKQDHATPPVLLGATGRQFGCVFGLDLAANESNAKCSRYLTPAIDSLAQDWTATLAAETEEDRFWREDHLAAWLNPPFRGVGAWMEKCREESEKGCRIVSLTLASLGTTWYRKHVEGRALSFILRKRVTFLGQKDPFPKELMVTLWGFGLSGLAFWDPPAWAVREDLAADPRISVGSSPGSDDRERGNPPIAPEGETAAEAPAAVREESDELWPLPEEA